MEPTPPPTDPFSTDPQQPPSPDPSTLPSTTAPRPRPGRPLSLTREVADRIVEAVEQGSYLKIAAQAAGVGQSTLAGWLARGRQAAADSSAHEASHLYCPSCDLDRLAEVNARDAAQQALDVQYEADLAEWRDAIADLDDDAIRPEQPSHAGVVLDRCPRCSSQEHPVEWQLPADEAPFLELLEEVTRAQAAGEVAAVRAWRSAFTGRDPDWRAARDYLARVAPERWAGVTRVQMSGDEAERRIDDAVNEALVALGVDQLLADEVDLALDEPEESLDA